MKRRSRTTRRNPVARAVKRLRPKVMRAKRGKGSYRRKDRRTREDGAGNDAVGPAETAK